MGQGWVAGWLDGVGAAVGSCIDSRAGHAGGGVVDSVGRERVAGGWRETHPCPARANAKHQPVNWLISFPNYLKFRQVSFRLSTLMLASFAVQPYTLHRWFVQFANPWNNFLFDVLFCLR